MSKKMGIGMIVNLTGALIAYLIGSGFATGQEVMQYFSGWGNLWAPILVGVLTLALAAGTYVTYAYAGRTRGIDSLNGVFEFYTGKVIGKLFTVFAWLFNTCCFTFMISGFGSTLNQQWGLALPIGCAIAVVLAVGTAILGLGKIVDVIGKIGPVIVILTLIISLIAAFTYFPRIAAGNELINSGAVEVTRAGSSPLTAGLSYAGCNLLLVSAFVARIGYDIRGYKFKYSKIILIAGSASIVIVAYFCGMNHIGNIEEATHSAIPNLLLANNILGGGAGAVLGTVFAIVILLAIYSTICPMVWTVVSTFIKDEKSTKYKLATIAFGIIVYIVTLFVPYQTLLNYIMTYCGYSGAIVAVVCIVRYFMVKAQDKKIGRKVDDFCPIEPEVEV